MALAGIFTAIWAAILAYRRDFLDMPFLAFFLEFLDAFLEPLEAFLAALEAFLGLDLVFLADFLAADFRAGLAGFAPRADRTR